MDRSTRTNVLTTTTTVGNESNAAHDTKVYAFAPQEEVTGCDGHGTPEFHTRVAAELASIVKQKTGW
jgi:hypothetical protein